MNLLDYSEYLFPLAMGLGGAALYHLGGIFLYWLTLGYEADASLRKLVNQNVDLTLNLAKASGLHKVNTDALYERVKALEEQGEKRATGLESGDCFWTPPYAPINRATYAELRSGKPCPKPTKDLRPGDEVSVRAVVKRNRLGSEFPSIDLMVPGNGFTLIYHRQSELDSDRTDNK